MEPEGLILPAVSRGEEASEMQPSVDSVVVKTEASVFSSIKWVSAKTAPLVHTEMARFLTDRHTGIRVLGVVTLHFL